MKEVICESCGLKVIVEDNAKVETPFYCILCESVIKKQKEAQAQAQEIKVIKIDCPVCSSAFAIKQIHKSARCKCPKCNSNLYAHPDGRVEVVVIKEPKKEVTPAQPVAPVSVPEKIVESVKEQPQPQAPSPSPVKPLPIDMALLQQMQQKPVKKPRTPREQAVRDTAIICLIILIIISFLLFLLLTEGVYQSLGTIMKNGFTKMQAFLRQPAPVSQPAKDKESKRTPQTPEKIKRDLENPPSEPDTSPPKESKMAKEKRKIEGYITNWNERWKQYHTEFQNAPLLRRRELSIEIEMLKKEKEDLLQRIKEYEKKFNTKYDGTWFVE